MTLCRAERPPGGGGESAPRQSLGPQLREGLLFISAGGLHGDQLDTMLPAKLGQFSDTFAGVGKEVGDAVGADPSLQGTRRNIYSTNDLGHGNLPCTCDWKSGDCTVVRPQRRAVPKLTHGCCRRDHGRSSPRQGFEVTNPWQRHFSSQSAADLQIPGIGCAAAPPGPKKVTISFGGST